MRHLAPGRATSPAPRGRGVPLCDDRARLRNPSRVEAWRANIHEPTGHQDASVPVKGPAFNIGRCGPMPDDTTRVSVRSELGSPGDALAGDADASPGDLEVDDAGALVEHRDRPVGRRRSQAATRGGAATARVGSCRPGLVTGATLARSGHHSARARSGRLRFGAPPPISAPGGCLMWVTTRGARSPRIEEVQMSTMFSWREVDPAPGRAVAPDERLSWGKTVGHRRPACDGDVRGDVRLPRPSWASARTWRS